MGNRTTFVHTARLAPTPYAAAAVVESGRLVFAAGACQLDADGRVVAPGDVAEQARAVIRNLTEQLAAAGATLADVVSTRVSVATSDRAELVAAWDVVHAAFADTEPPSTLIGVTVLGYPDQLVEVEAVAVIGAV
jgi:enamine deaminase RidA (YjgF/YER057c/UK114 family)